MSRITFRAFMVALASLASCLSARGGDQDEGFRLFARYHQKKQGTPPPGPPRDIPNTDERAGFPRTMSGHPEPTTTSGGIGYYVGGGVPFGARHGDAPYRLEGTWGWDETGCGWFRRRVLLGWSHGRRYQGGAGAYRTDGSAAPDVIFATASIANSLTRRKKSEDHE